jgi:hypothetical protein
VARGCPKRTVVRAPAGYGVTVGCPTPAVARGPGRLRRGGWAPGTGSGARPRPATASRVAARHRQWCGAAAGYEVGEGLGDAVPDAPGFGLAWCFGVAVGVGTAGGGE